MADFKKKKQTEGIKHIAKPVKKAVKVDPKVLAAEAKERSKDQSFFQRFLNFFKKDKH